MNCYYCDRIRACDPEYPPSAAAFDLGSEAPRCPLHWRYVCDKCRQPSHFMATAHCDQSDQFYCSRCAAAREEVVEPFWRWKYYARLQSPWSEAWHPTLDYLEYEGRHPHQRRATNNRPGLSNEPYLMRYPAGRGRWPLDHDPDDSELNESWNRNAEKWTATYDDDGDRTRKYQTDATLLAMLGDVSGARLLDAGCGNGYLARKLAKQGAKVVGVDLCERFHAEAIDRERAEPLGVEYQLGSICSMPQFPAASFDKAVSNFVLMDVGDYQRAVTEVFRVLKPGGVWVCLFGHPCFDAGPGVWHKPAPDSPRREERFAWMVDDYFYRGPVAAVWGKFEPVVGFQRPLSDYWRAFVDAGFRVDAFDEPSVSEAGLNALTPAQLEQVKRRPYACIFKLSKPRA